RPKLTGFSSAASWKDFCGSSLMRRVSELAKVALRRNALFGGLPVSRSGRIEPALHPIASAHTQDQADWSDHQIVEGDEQCIAHDDADAARGEEPHEVKRLRDLRQPPKHRARARAADGQPKQARARMPAPEE